MFGSDQERLARFERKADLFEDAQFQVKEGLKMNIHSRIGSLICVALLATALSLACATPPAPTPAVESPATAVPTLTSVPPQGAQGRLSPRCCQNGPK